MKTQKLSLFKGYHYPMKIYKDNYENGGFTQLSLDLTSNCNYSCDWCFNKHLINKNTEKLSLDEKKDLLEQAFDLGTKTLVIPGTGEPTLDSDFYPLMNIANKLRLTAVVYTNLTGNIDSEKIKMLYDNNVSIGIKLDSFDKYYFSKRYHNKKSFEKFMNNLSETINIYKDSKEIIDGNKVYRIAANMVLTEENKSELKKIYEFCNSNDLPLFIRPVKPVNWAKENLSEWEKIGNSSGNLTPDKSLINLANKYNMLFSPSSTPENHCALYAFGLTVKEDGDIQICPDHHDSKGKFGNVRDKPLKKVIKELNKERSIKPGFCVMLPDIEF